MCARCVMVLWCDTVRKSGWSMNVPGFCPWSGSCRCGYGTSSELRALLGTLVRSIWQWKVIESLVTTSGSLVFCLFSDGWISGSPENLSKACLEKDTEASPQGNTLSRLARVPGQPPNVYNKGTVAFPFEAVFTDGRDREKERACVGWERKKRETLMVAFCVLPTEDWNRSPFAVWDDFPPTEPPGQGFN